MTESNVMKYIMLALGRIKTLKVFRNNVAQAWVGEVVKRTPTTITLRDPRPLHAGLIKGSPDLVGWKTIEIKTEHLGKKVAVFVGIEVKGERTRTTQEQLTFLQNLKNDGGIAGIARSEQDALNIIDNQ